MEWAVTNKTPEYLAKYPLGKIPGFEGADGTLLSESNAIANYIAEVGSRRDQLLGATPLERARIEQWLFFGEVHVETVLHNLCYMRAGLLPYSADVDTTAVSDFRRWFDILEKHMEGERKWFANALNGPSMADLVIGGALAFGFTYYIDAELRRAYPNLVSFFSRLEDVPELAGVFTVQMIETRKEF